jgi:hypothetical protein
MGKRGAGGRPPSSSVWHLFEHALLLGQALIGTTLWGAPQPTSVLQLIVPRIELHLAYNGVVLAGILMAIACRGVEEPRRLLRHP